MPINLLCKFESSKMEQTEDQLQSPGICHRIFCFIMKILTSHAMKPVTLGDPRHLKVTVEPTANPTQQLPDRHCTADDQPSSSMLQTGTSECPDLHAISKNDPEPDSASVILVQLIESDSVNSINGSLVLGEKARESTPGAPVQKRAAKKLVSINDEAEVIDMGKKRRKLALEKQISALRNEDSIEPRPLKSILRVGSNLE